MSAQMVMMYRSLAFICADLGIGEKAKAYEARAAGIAGRINAFMWNEKEGLYFDIDDAGKQIAWKSAACFWPMLAGVASPAQCERMALHLKDPRSFWRAIPFATLAADQPGYRPDGDYWLGSVWAPTNVMIIKGLERMGFDEFATTASEAYLDGLYAVYKKTGTFWENYAPDALTRGSDSRPDFVGWTGCGPIQLLIENVLGIRADGATKTISWYLHRRDRHGIKKLHMGDATVSLIAARRQAFNSPAAITVTSDRPLTLKVLAQGGTTSYAIAVGTQTITVPGR
jgi:neutral trehalase